ncbi:MAG: hypothetical protein WC666_01355 [Candidatus Paceibacterota bacterium]|jgi:hypothetical protein
MKVFIFGNPDILIDSLPLRILPQLKVLYPNIEFEVKDPNEEWDFSSRPRLEARPRGEASDLTIIDTAIGIKKVTVFHDLKQFALPPRLGMHDFDAFTNLRYLMKLGKINTVTIIGIPPEINEEKAIEEISKLNILL